jgi:hypothetical protein
MQHQPFGSCRSVHHRLPRPEALSCTASFLFATDFLVTIRKE